MPNQKAVFAKYADKTEVAKNAAVAQGKYRFWRLCAFYSTPGAIAAFLGNALFSDVVCKNGFLDTKLKKSL